MPVHRLLLLLFLPRTRFPCVYGPLPLAVKSGQLLLLPQTLYAHALPSHHRPRPVPQRCWDALRAVIAASDPTEADA